mmetsp:Transcript_40096/g.96811  ORF Transcript_40096/g.96811 Transcript_40096/m.96811 type:complete len:507 (-) Transcript_40096:307-1827(-)
MSSTSTNSNKGSGSGSTNVGGGGQHPSTEEIVGVLVKNGFVIPVKLQFQSPSPSPSLPTTTQEEEEEEEATTTARPTTTYYLTPGTTVTDLKQLIYRRHGIEPQNQRLGLVLGGDGGGGNEAEDGGGEGGPGGGEGVRRRPIFYGRFLLDSATQRQSATVSVEDVPVDPTWQAFYDMTGYDDWKERDQITQSMYSGRRARHCPEGYPLRVGTHTRLPCVKCGFVYDPDSELVRRRNGEWHAVVPMVSEIVNDEDRNRDGLGVGVGVDNHHDRTPFVLCNFCYDYDSDTPADLTTAADPYRLILRLAVDLGQRLTSSTARFSGWGPFRVPQVSLPSSLVEFSNKKMRPKPTGLEPVVIPEGESPEEETAARITRRVPPPGVGMEVTGSESQVVVPAGIRVVVKLNDGQRQAVIDAGHGEKLSSVEFDDENRQNPLSSRDVIELRESIHRRNNLDLWDAIKGHMYKQEPWNIGGLFTKLLPSLELVTYDVDRVVFELSVIWTEYGGDY